MATETQSNLPPVMTVDKLTWCVDGKPLLNEISFAIPTGSMLGLIGPNGAGKSSLLRCLYRFIKAQQGHISLDGRDVESFSAKAFARCVAVVQQDTPSQLDVSVRELVAMGLTPHKGWLEFDSRQDRLKVSAALDKVGMQALANRSFNLLSGGEKQRALIARAIVQQPRLLILDEPTNHLDIRYQIQILELVRSLGISVIASIHDLNLASALCDKLLLLNGGQLVARGRPEQVLTEAMIADVFGVCCQITPHPQHGKPLISYFYGYQTGAEHGE